LFFSRLISLQAIHLQYFTYTFILLSAPGKEMASTVPVSSLQPSDLEGDRKEQELSSPSSDQSEKESNKVTGTASFTPPVTEEHDWVSGIKLLTIMAAITLVCFLMLLDTSIVVTVKAKGP
jgi:hypothetical protein